MEQFLRFTWGRATFLDRIFFVCSLGLLSSLALGLLVLAFFIPVFAVIFIVLFGAMGIAASIIFLLDRIDDFKTYKRLGRHG